MTPTRVPLWLAEAWGLVPVELTPEQVAIRVVLYCCAAILMLFGLLVVVVSLWEEAFRKEAESRRLERAYKRALAADAARDAQRAMGIYTEAVPVD